MSSGKSYRFNHRLVQLFCFMAGLVSEVLLAGPAAPVQEWRGEDLGKREGAFYLKMQMKGFPGVGSEVPDVQTVQIYFYSILQKKNFVLSHFMDDNSGTPSSIWKVRAGKYRIRKVSLVDSRGVTRQWKAKSKGKAFIVKRRALSNLGMLIVKPLKKKKKKLKLSMKMIANSYDDERAKSDLLLTSVINAYDGNVQKKIAGKRALSAHKKTVEAKTKLHHEYTFRRKIVMYFRLNLFKHNRYSKTVIKALAQNDPRFRTCYMERLNDNENLKGQLKFKFLLSTSISSMKKLRFGGGSLKDPKMVSCIYNELNGMQFPVAETMIGELVFTFDVR